MIHDTAIISSSAVIDENVSIGPYSIIHAGVRIGENTVIGPYCEIGVQTRLAKKNDLVIGANSIIRSHSVFYIGSEFSSGLITGHNVNVRENTVAGCSLQIGSYSEIQGDTHFGKYVRLQSNVFVGKYSTVEDYVWLLPHCILTNDSTPPSDYLIGPKLLKFSTICAGALVMPGITIGRHSMVAANACVTRDVGDYTLVAGVPAKPIKSTKDLVLKDGTNRQAYPWPHHFSRGYPSDIFGDI
jgi:acetyltransferase-like isoleucine patch superfamily enzyme